MKMDTARRTAAFIDVSLKIANAVLVGLSEESFAAIRTASKHASRSAWAISGSSCSSSSSGASSTSSSGPCGKTMTCLLTDLQDARAPDGRSFSVLASAFS